MKKVTAALLTGALMITTTGCAFIKGSEDSYAQEGALVTSEVSEVSEVASATEVSTENTKEETKTSEASTSETIAEEEAKQKTPEEMTPEELFKAFCDGEILAKTLPDENGETYEIDAKNFEFDELTDALSYVTIEEPLDIDNDGLLEYTLKNYAYGEMWFDCKDGQVICFARGSGTEDSLSHQYFENAYWIVHSGYVGSGEEGGASYRFDKYNGELQITKSYLLSYVGTEDNRKYYLDEQEISEQDYNTWHDAAFAQNKAPFKTVEYLGKDNDIEFNVGGKHYTLTAVPNPDQGYTEYTLSDGTNSTTDQLWSYEQDVYRINKGKNNFLYICFPDPGSAHYIAVYNLNGDKPSSPVVYNGGYALYSGTIEDIYSFELQSLCTIFGSTSVYKTFHINAEGMPVSDEEFAHYDSGCMNGERNGGLEIIAKKDMETEIGKEPFSRTFIKGKISAGTKLRYYQTNEENRIEFLDEKDRIVSFRVFIDSNGDSYLNSMYSVDDFENVPFWN